MLVTVHSLLLSCLLFEDTLKRWCADIKGRQDLAEKESIAIDAACKLLVQVQFRQTLNSLWIHEGGGFSQNICTIQ